MLFSEEWQVCIVRKDQTMRESKRQIYGKLNMQITGTKKRIFKYLFNYSYKYK
jgi:hypothetical protein